MWLTGIVIKGLDLQSRSHVTALGKSLIQSKEHNLVRSIAIFAVFYGLDGIDNQRPGRSNSCSCCSRVYNRITDYVKTAGASLALTLVSSTKLITLLEIRIQERCLSINQSINQ